jgi:hypothetical protein
MSPAVGFMIAKTFFLVKEIHRIGTRSLRGKKSLHENQPKYRTFIALRAARRLGARGWAARRLGSSGLGGSAAGRPGGSAGGLSGGGLQGHVLVLWRRVVGVGVRCAVGLLVWIGIACVRGLIRCVRAWLAGVRAGMIQGPVLSRHARLQSVAEDRGSSYQACSLF